MSENRSRVRIQTSSARGESTASPAPTRSIPTLKSAVRHGLLRHRHVEEQLRDKDGEVFLPQSIYQKIMEHLSSDTSRELGGLLVGTELEGDDGRPTILIQDALPARHTRSHQTRLNFSEETWADFNRELDALEAQGVKLQRVGWYHSHPQMGIFLSPWDLDVCREFRRPTQVALVIDPCEPKGGFFVQGPKGFRDHAPQGFWEMKDLTSDSVVRWTGLTQGPELPSSFLLDWLTPGAAVRPDAQPRTNVIASRQPALISSPNNRYKPPAPKPPLSDRRPSQWITGAAMILAIIAMAAAIWNYSERKHAEDLLAKSDATLKEVDQAAREQAAQAAEAAREQAARDHTLKDQTLKDQTLKDQTLEDQPLKDQTTKVQITKDQTTKVQITKVQITKDQTTKGQTTKGQTTKDQTTKDQTTKDQTTKDQTTKDQTTKDQAAKDQTTKDQATKDQTTKDQATKDQTTKDQTGKEKAPGQVEDQSQVNPNKKGGFWKRVLGKGRDQGKENTAPPPTPGNQGQENTAPPPQESSGNGSKEEA